MATRPTTSADQAIARLQAAHDQALRAETAAYDLYIALPFGEADALAEILWHEAQAVTKQAHAALLAAIDARRDGVTHTVIVADSSPLVTSGVLL